MFLQNLNKFQRIEFVKNLGLNTENSILLKHNSDFPYIDDAFINKHDKFSLRTFYDYFEIKKTLHYPTVTKKELFDLIPKLKEEKLNMIISEQIDPKDCEFAACMLILQDKIIIEQKYGAYTVRAITHDYNIDNRFIISRFNEIVDDSILNQMIRIARNINLIDISIEFSYYKKPVGWKNEKLIIWEIKQI